MLAASITDSLARAPKIDALFSGWTGSHKQVETEIKGQLSDPSSYEHISTNYYDYGDTNIVVITKYRAADAAGNSSVKVLKVQTAITGELKRVIEWR